MPPVPHLTPVDQPRQGEGGERQAAQEQDELECGEIVGHTDILAWF